MRVLYEWSKKVSTDESAKFPLDPPAHASQSVPRKMKRWMPYLFCLLVACSRSPAKKVVAEVESLLVNGQVEKAQALLQDAAAQMPDSLEIHREAIILLLRTEQIPSARVLVARLPVGDPALRLALRHRDGVVRTQAAKLIADLPDAVSVRDLIRGMDDSVAEVRAYCARAAGKRGDRSALKQLFRLLNDSSWLARAEAADAMATIGDPQAAGWLIYRLRDSDGFVRYRVAVALRELACPANHEVLQRALKLPGVKQSFDVAVALAKLGDPLALGPLTNAVNDSDSEVRRRAVDALLECGLPAGTNALAQLARDQDTTVRTKAEKALRAWSPRVSGAN